VTGKRVLIYCLPGDFHAVAVRWGLQQLGCETVMWYPGDLPDYQASSFHFADGMISVSIRSNGCDTITFDDVGAVWNRRYPKPVAPEWVSKADKAMVEEQCFQHMQGLRHFVSHGVFTVNAPTVETNASKKLLQIKVASDCGFSVPATLASNSFEDVTDFWHHHGGQVVVKPFVGAAWESAEGVHSFFATMMPEPHKDLADSIGCAPNLYQRVIADRQFDVRLIFVDGDKFACSIHSDLCGKVDIRPEIRYGTAKHEQVKVPADVAAAVDRYCQILDMRYGAFDFIVDTGGRWWFLECNSAGQFLWLEDMVAGVPLLDAFCKMFVRNIGSPTEDGARISLRDFRSSGVWQAEQAIWPGPHKPGVIINGYQPEDAHDLALVSSPQPRAAEATGEG
jgi:glutathione synthase/RimK-type ligase-like ATP-grasp enzyme